MTIKQWFATYFILLGCFAGAVAIGRQLYHNCGQPLWACMVLAGIAFVLLVITIFPLLAYRLGTRLPWEEQP